MSTADLREALEYALELMVADHGEPPSEANEGYTIPELTIMRARAALDAAPVGEPLRTIQRKCETALAVGLENVRVEEMVNEILEIAGSAPSPESVEPLRAALERLRRVWESTDAEFWERVPEWLKREHLWGLSQRLAPVFDAVREVRAALHQKEHGH